MKSGKTRLYCSSGRISLVCTATALLLAAPGHERTASACGNEVYRKMDPRVASVQRAEAFLSGGSYEAAMVLIVRGDLLFRGDPQLPKRKVGTDSLSDRGLLVLARATARSDGKVFHEHSDEDPSQAQRDKALQWAAQIAKEMHVRKADDAASATDLGEILSHVPARRAEALGLLVNLEKKDVVASADGYAALAAMRAEIGADYRGFVRGPLWALHDASRAIEEARCKQMTKSEKVCARSERGG